MWPKEVAQAVKEISENRISGSLTLADKALMCFSLLVQKGDVNTKQDLWAKTQALSVYIAQSQSAMQAMQFWPWQVLYSLNDLMRTKMDLVDLKQSFLEVLSLLHEELIDEIDHVVTQALNVKAETVITLSNSTVVTEICKKGLVEKMIKKVIICESRPGLEGRKVAEKLSSHGDVELLVDCALFQAVSRSDRVYLSADSLTEQSFVNKIGSHLLAIAAKEQNVPVDLLVTRSKCGAHHPQGIDKLYPSEEVWDKAPKNILIENRYFEEVSIELLSNIVTDRGRFSPKEVPFHWLRDHDPRRIPPPDF